MLRDVPHCKSILKCGAGALILGIVMLTWLYPAYCSRVSQVKETKVREFVEGQYGISDRSGEPFASDPERRRELQKAVQPRASTFPGDARAPQPGAVSVRAEPRTPGKMR